LLPPTVASGVGAVGAAVGGSSATSTGCGGAGSAERTASADALETARNMFRKTLALRVDPANAVAVSFYRTQGFTTVATVVSKKSGKLRLLMSREL